MAQAAAQQPGQRWLYNQRTGQLRAPDGRLAQERGYSGAPGFVNDPEAEHLRNRGPIPRGQWNIGNAFNGTRGPVTMRLNPVDHNAHGRTDMQIHGDRRGNPNREASQGCIIFTRQQREAIMRSRVRRLDVVNEPEWQQ